MRHLAPSPENSSSHSEIDECLQPKSRAPISLTGMTSITNTPPSTRLQFWPSASSHTISDGSCAPQNQHNWNQERLRYAKANGLDPDALHLGNGSECSSLRYRAGDSLNVFGKDDVDSEYDSGRSQAQVKTTYS